jgi:hypothetical protein
MEAIDRHGAEVQGAGGPASGTARQVQEAHPTIDLLDRKEPKSEKESTAGQEKLKGFWYTVISKDGSKHEDSSDSKL